MSTQPYLTFGPTPDEDRLVTIQDALGFCGESRDEVGSLTRINLATELVGIVLRRHGKFPVDVEATKTLDESDRLSGISIVDGRWRTDREFECDELIPRGCSLKVRIERRAKGDKLAVRVVDQSDWAAAQKKAVS